MGAHLRQLLVWVAALIAMASSSHAGDFSRAMAQAVGSSGATPQALAQPTADVAQAPALLRHFMTDPPAAWRSVDALRHWPQARKQPGELYRLLTTEAAGPTAAADSAGKATKDRTERPDRPAKQPQGALPTVPVPSHIPEPLATELRRAFHGLALAEAWRQRALSGWPAELTPQAVLAQSIPAAASLAGPGPAAQALPAIDRAVMRTGMRILLATAERLHAFITQAAELPPVVWRTETPWGTVLVDTTGQNNQHRLQHTLLVLDVGGDDNYHFDLPPAGARPGVHLLLDHGGHDRYRSHAAGSDPSGAVLGLALLWDTKGDDDYQASWLGQGAAVLGAAIHIDDAGHNRYRATGMAQGFALAGDALLLGSPGDDDYRALTLAQASAGPGGLALLLEPGGDDRYHLGNEVLVWPSSQLPDRNASLGQGAGYGTAAGSGLALLIDAAGDDSYRAQVFAQGAGLRRGLGALLDLGGHNRLEAAWYAMGAAAHGGVGLLWAAGTGDDSYTASHVSAMGAGHDGAVGLLVDGGGQDRMLLQDLGLGAAHDGGHGVLVRTGGAASYRFTGTACRGLGRAYASAGGGMARSTAQGTGMGTGLWVDATGLRPCEAP